MFDDQPNTAPTPPTNLPVEPEDMFNELEKPPAPPQPSALATGMLKPKENPASPKPIAQPIRTEPSVTVPPALELMGKGSMMAPASNPILGKVLLVVLILVVLGGGAFGGWWFYTNTVGGTKVPSNQSTTNQTVNQPVPTSPVAPSPDTAITTTTASDEPTSLPPDFDKDGLTDDQEKALGTDSLKADTDGDGLSDGEEVIIYHSNPLKADTDSDGYSDGQEVKNGYNPLGPGKLTTGQLPSASTSSAAEGKPSGESTTSPSTSSSTTSTKQLPPAVIL